MQLRFLFSILVLMLWQPANSQEKSLRIALIQEWADFNPVTYNLASVEALLPFVVRGLSARVANGAVVPDLAEKIPTLKDKDLRILTIGGRSQVQADWRIRPGARWGDGEPVVCADLKLGWQAGLNSHVSTLSRANYSKIEKIEWQETSPQLCKVTYLNADWSFDRDLPFLLPSKIEAGIYEKNKNENQAYDKNSNYVKAPKLAGLYNGPYLISEFKIGSHLILKPNPFYQGKKSNLGKIVVSSIADTSALRAQILARQVDAVSAVGFPADVAISLSEEFSKAEEPVKIRFQESSIFQGLFFNLEHPLLKDPLLRQALAKSINKAALVQAFFKGQILAAESFIPPQHPLFRKMNAEYSKDQARKLLEQAGWKVGAKGLREKQGKILSLQFKTSAGIKIYESIQAYVCDQFKQVGVGCEIKNEPARVLLGDSVPKGDFAIAMFGLPIPPDSSLASLFSSAEIPSEKNAWAGGNQVRWRNPKLDALLKKFDSEWDPRAREKLILKMQEVYFEDRPFIPLYHRREAMVIPKKLEGVTDDFNGTGFVFPENWQMP